MTDAALIQRLDKMADALVLLAGALGKRLNKGDLADRMGVHRNTLAKRLATDPNFPRPGKDGKWLLSDVIEWEQRQS